MKSFIYLCTIWHATNITFMHNTALQKFKFFWFMGIAKMTCIHAQYHEIFWLKFLIHAKFRVKKNYLLRMNAQFRAKLFSYWYENDAKFRAKKSHFVQKHETVAQENWLFSWWISLIRYKILQNVVKANLSSAQFWNIYLHEAS